jgi:hypothetical protein
MAVMVAGAALVQLLALTAGLVLAEEVLVLLPTQIPSLVLAAEELGGAAPSLVVTALQHLELVAMA